MLASMPKKEGHGTHQGTLPGGTAHRHRSSLPSAHRLSPGPLTPTQTYQRGLASYHSRGSAWRTPSPTPFGWMALYFAMACAALTWTVASERRAIPVLAQAEIQRLAHQAQRLGA